jgi:polysaccharide biosynthesis transport protein
MNLSQLHEVLKARKVIALATSAAVLATVVGVTLILPERYTATATVVIDSKSPDPVNGMTMQGTMLPGYIATQLDILRSERVTYRVIRMLKLDENAEMRKQWQDETKGVGSYESWLSEALQKSLEVIPSRESSVINVAYSGLEPNFSAAMANAFVRAYLDTSLELRVEPAKQFSALFEEQSRETRDKLEQAQNRLSAYQKEKGIIATDERLDIETARLNELSNQLTLLQAISAESASRKAQAGANAQEVLNNPVVAGLKADMSRQEARLKELTASLGANHPQVVQLQENIREMRARIDQEIGRVASSLGINNTVNQSREAQVRRALDAQRQKLLQLKEQRDEAALLLADVANAQRSYDALQARYMQTRLESQINQTNISVLKVATPPPKASSPKLILNIVVGTLLAGMVGVGAALFRESLDRRVRESDDFEALGGIFLGLMPDAVGTKGRLTMPLTDSPRLATRGIPRLLGPATK